MSIINWKKRNGMFPGLSSLADNFFNDDHFFSMKPDPAVMPAVNVKETDDAFELEVAAPGVKKEDFNVTVDKGVLTISSEAKSETQEEKDNYTRKEFSYSAFSRSFWLPENVKDDDIQANYEDGVLKVKVAKTAVASESKAKQINVT